MQWFYRLSHRNREKSIGLIDPATEIVNKALALYIGPPKSLKSTGFLNRATETIKKALVL